MRSYLPRSVLGLLATLTLVLAVGGSLGAWPTGAPASGDERPLAAPRAGAWPAAVRVPARAMEGSDGDIHRPDDATAEGDVAGDGATAAGGEGDEVAGRTGEATDVGERDEAPALPSRSGAGRRVVFDMSEQRVWLVTPADRVRRSYLVSGSATDNLDPGRYAVYSRSRHAVSYDYESTMRYMVRFAHGERAAIGFHDIPRDQRGRPVQTWAQLGRPLSSGCIRQARPDAIALWRFAGIGTPVVVLR